MWKCIFCNILSNCTTALYLHQWKSIFYTTSNKTKKIFSNTDSLKSNQQNLVYSFVDYRRDGVKLLIMSVERTWNWIQVWYYDDKLLVIYNQSQINASDEFGTIIKRERNNIHCGNFILSEHVLSKIWIRVVK